MYVSRLPWMIENGGSGRGGCNSSFGESIGRMQLDPQIEFPGESSRQDERTHQIDTAGSMRAQFQERVMRQARPAFKREPKPFFGS
jgi:hypothetical protein